MDPDANLAEQLTIAAAINEAYDCNTEPDPADGARLAELVIALNDWIAGGGFLPAAWRRP